MYGLVSFAFAGGHFSRKKYCFKTHIENFKLGDLVVVEGVLPGETTIAMFIRYEQEDLFPENKRKLILRKAHGNTLKSLVNKRYQYFSTFNFHKGIFKMVKKKFPEFFDMTEEEIKNMLVYRLSVAPKIAVPSKQVEKYYYDNMQIVSKNDEVITVTENNKETTWRRPTQLEKYLI